jgi:hypothetical protein
VGLVGGVIAAVAVPGGDHELKVPQFFEFLFNRPLGELRLGNDLGAIPPVLPNAKKDAQDLGADFRVKEEAKLVH